MDGISEALTFIAGFSIGFLGGLLPGLHSNTIISVLASLGIDGSALGIMIVSLFPAHMISSFIPSIFFGVPESGTVVAVLPGQRMVLRGEGVKALCTVLLSCVLSALLACALFHPTLSIFPPVYEAIRPHMRFILLGISIVLLLRTKAPVLSAAVFALSGILGYFSLNSGMPDPFLPLFSGMFAMAAMERWKKGAAPPQKDLPAAKGIMLFATIGVVLGFAADLIPGVGSPSQMAVFATMLMPMDTSAYLATISSISVSQAVFSLSTSASIGKSRVGATAWLSESMDIGASLPMLLALFIVSLALAAALAYALRLHAARLASLDFSSLRIVLAAYIVAITLIIDGWPGLAVLAISTGLGKLTLEFGVERTNLMGAIIVPTLMLLFRIFP
ncbi:MAG: tripartite tricarboxylate transporter permease [Candidatus Micrarchaeota archaeon]